MSPVYLERIKINIQKINSNYRSLNFGKARPSAVNTALDFAKDKKEKGGFFKFTAACSFAEFLKR